MTVLASSQTHVGCLVVRTVLGRSGKQFQSEVERLIDSNGPEWVVTRLKAIWNASNHLRNGDWTKAQEVYRMNGISYHKSDMTPKGPFRPAVRGYIHAQRPSVVKRYAAVLRYYTSITLGELTPQQSAKAYAAITEESPRAWDGGERCVADLDLIRNPVLNQLRRKTEHWEPSVQQRYADGLHASSSYYSRFKLPRAFRGEPYASMAMSFMTEPWLPEVLDTRTPCKEMREHIRMQPGFPDQEFAGAITILQEQGGKARVVAKPSAWLQLAFMPLHRRLAGVAEHAFPKASCVEDQQRGAYGVLRHMQEGKPVFCTDLSSATDRFPRTYSIALLEQLGMSDYAEALELVCQTPFTSPWGPVTYGTGQPMGLYGSFPLFHLSHLVVAGAAEISAQVKCMEWGEPLLTRFASGSTHYVLGDDIVFSDERVATEYRFRMSEMGVPISEHKSFEGNLAEFAGFMVVTTNHGAVAFRPYKVPSGDQVSNPISFLDSLGVKVANISPYWEKQFTRYQATVGHRGLDLSPLVSVNDGGPHSNVYRGDSKTLVNLSNALVTLSGDPLPDLSGSTQINTIPLFGERGMFDFYGFNPEELKASEKEAKHLQRRRVQVGIRNDPVLKLYEDKPEVRAPSEPTTPEVPSSYEVGPELPYEDRFVQIPKRESQKKELLSNPNKVSPLERLRNLVDQPLDGSRDADHRQGPTF